MHRAWRLSAAAESHPPFGQEISRSTYAAYFAMVGTTYGAGSGGTTFNVIDKRGGAAGKDDMGGSAASRITNVVSGIGGSTLGSAGGAQSVVLVQGNLPNVTLGTSIASRQGSHAHDVRYSVVNNDAGGGGGGHVQGIFASAPATATDAAPAKTLPSMTGTTPTGGSDTPINKMPPTIIVNYILRVL